MKLELRWDTDSNPQNPGWVGSVGDNRGWQPVPGNLPIDADEADLLDAAEDLAMWEGWENVEIIFPEI